LIFCAVEYQLKKERHQGDLEIIRGFIGLIKHLLLPIRKTSAKRRRLPETGQDTLNIQIKDIS
jgi:hypothetical protein